MRSPAEAYLHRMFSLEGRTALITGGSSGIGHAMAEAIGLAGASVVLVARRETELTAAAGKLRAHGVDAHILPADLADEDAVRHVCDHAATFAGDIDILVNAAANNIRRPMDQLTRDDYDVTVRVNLTAPYLLGAHFGPRMAARGFGRIINVASQQAVRAFGDSGVYGVSKAALTGLTRSQAEAWSPRGVRVHTVMPGFVLTPLTEAAQAVPGRVEAMAARTLTGRNGDATDLAGVAVLLAGDACAGMTGQSVYVDGGFSVH
ncbi:glucose 1-dehydrogenase [Sphaerisporangium rubeum]|uniref:SDR family NAD(P)-dependent oxidoreductase n=1 Tax=Sphaerisporangium rubeum TaxID=321317 RepID=UPI0031E0ABCC